VPDTPFQMKTRTSSRVSQCVSPFLERATIDLALQLTAKMEHALSAHGDRVILKLTHQHEVEVLRRLHANQPTKRTHIIPLVDIVDRRLMVLPLRMPLLEFLNLEASVGYVELLALQFLEGVAYLQHCSVAHLDLKPGNVVVQWDSESGEVDLNIVDFDISVFADAEPTISASRGTAGWWAPEVSAGKPYSPLLADRWSCGRVLMVFTECMKPSRMRETTRSWSQRLMDPNPSLRPPVADVAKLCLQEMGGMLTASNRFPVSRPGRAPRLKGGPKRYPRELELHAWASPPIVKM
jgi:serine/threonine protein kinase